MNFNSQDTQDNNNRGIVEVGKWLTKLGINWDGDISQVKVHRAL